MRPKHSHTAKILISNTYALKNIYEENTVFVCKGHFEFIYVHVCITASAQVVLRPEEELNPLELLVLSHLARVLGMKP